VIEEAMSNFHRYFLVMPTLARFELEIHERVEAGQGLNAQFMIDRSLELFQAAYGPAMELPPEQAGMYWSMFGHLYRDYYVYQYATGIAAAQALAARILAGEAGSVEAYLAFLAKGGSEYPIEALRQAGVDMTSSAPVEAAFDNLEAMVDDLERLL
jgi:oligoendopeptidase F